MAEGGEAAVPFPCGIPAGVFSQLKALVEDSLDRNAPLDGDAVDALGVDFESAFSLRGQMLTRRVRRTAPTVRQAMPELAALWKQGGEGNDVVSLARKSKCVQGNPCLALFVVVCLWRASCVPHMKPPPPLRWNPAPAAHIPTHSCLLFFSYPAQGTRRTFLRGSWWSRCWAVRGHGSGSLLSTPSSSPTQSSGSRSPTRSTATMTAPPPQTRYAQ